MVRAVSNPRNVVLSAEASQQIVAVTNRRRITEGSGDTVFAQGSALLDRFFAFGSFDAAQHSRAIYAFVAPLSSVRGIFIDPIGTEDLFLFPGGGPGGSPNSVDLSWRFEIISTSFDITAVTWNNQPASAAFGRTQTMHWDSTEAVGGAGGCRQANALGVLNASDTVGTFFGFKVLVTSLVAVNNATYGLFSDGIDLGQAYVIPTL